MTSVVGIEVGGCATTATASGGVQGERMRTFCWTVDFGGNLKMGEATVVDRSLEDKEEESIHVVLQ